MSTKYIVECPDCKVRFFVTEELLATAYGVLRCGFCSHVFNGKEYIVYQSLDSQTTTHSAAKSDLVPAQPADQNDKKANPIKAEDTPAYWSEVVDTLSSFSVSFNSKSDAEEPVLPKHNLIGSDEPQSQFVNEESSSAAMVELDLNHVDPDIVERIEHIDFDQLLVLDEQALLAKNVDEFSDNRVIENTRDDSLTPHITSNYTVEESEPKDIYGNSLKKVSYNDFILEPPLHKKTSKSFFIWGGLSILALLFLVGQYVRFIVPDMALHEESRDWAEKACVFLLCDLPPLVDVTKIKTNQLVVSESSLLDNVLNVDAIIESKLAIAQPYPVVELRFTDLNGQLVASRRFLPNEYLADDIMKNNQMQPNTPTYISLEIIDPSEAAVGYSLYYYPAK